MLVNSSLADTAELSGSGNWNAPLYPSINVNDIFMPPCTPHSVARGIMFIASSCVHPSVSPCMHAF